MENSFDLTLFSVLIATFSALCLYYSVRRDSRIAKVDLYLAFQNQFKAFQSKLPADINKRDPVTKKYCWMPATKEEERLIESYWWLVFDEWLACNKIIKFKRSLWKHYKKGVSDALEREAFREAFRRLAKNRNSFMGYDDKFCKVINKIYWKKCKGNPIEI